MANKRKTTTAVVAGVTAAALLLGGTFAWTSISQQAKNEAAGVVNVGGRLHDDFNGTNKDVYVENFTDPLDGGQPIYARIKLTEYMEIGQDAGGFGADTNGDGKVTAVPVVSGTSINDKDNWPVHVPEESCAACATAGTCRIHDHWTWTMGGEDTENNPNGKAVFMPTFNKDKDSLKADINGTYAGTNLTDKVYYDDYVTYVTADGITVDLTADFTPPEGAANASALTEAEGSVTTVKGTAYYDDDTDIAENDHANQIGVKVETETHTAKETATATVKTMAEWLADPMPGNFWVYDTDGWAYWANPIMPGEATGLLLDGIMMEKNPGEKCYYAINVVGQFATVNDWEYFYDENNEFDGTGDALTLLETAAKNVATVVVTNVSGATLLTPGESYEFSANVYVNGAAKYAATDFEWSVLNADLSAAKSTIEAGADDIATLSVDPSETGKNLIVVAKSKDANYLGALGMSSVAVDIKDYAISVLPQTVDDGEGGTFEVPFMGSMADGESWTLRLNLGGEPVTENVTWSMELIANAPGYSDTELEGTVIDPTTGVLTVAEGETSDSYTYHVVKVTASIDGEEMASENIVIAVSGIGISGLVFYEEGTLNRVDEADFVINTTYDVRPRYYNQDTYSDAMTELLDPRWDVRTAIVEKGGLETTSAALVDGKFTAKVPGDYVVTVIDEEWGYEFSADVTVGTTDPFYISYDANSVNKGESVNVTLVSNTDAEAPTDVTWELEGTYAEGTKLEEGVLHADVNETAKQIIVKATDTDGNTAKTTVPVTVVERLTILVDGTAYNHGDTVEIWTWNNGLGSATLAAKETNNVKWEIVSTEGSPDVFIGGNLLNIDSSTAGDLIVVKATHELSGSTSTITFKTVQ